MYERVKMQLILFQSEDVVRTSPLPEWSDENADSNGWS